MKNKLVTLLIMDGFGINESDKGNAIKRANKPNLDSYLAKYPNSETLEIGALSGAIFETFVVSEIIKNFTSHGLDPKMNLYYYQILLLSRFQ